MPARFDDTAIPGVPQTIGYVSLKDTSPEDLADLIKEKLTNTKANRDNALKAEVLTHFIKSPELMKAISNGNDDLAIELLTKEGKLEELLHKMFESGALE